MKINANAIRMRAFNPETDVNVIVNTWLKSYRNSAPMTSVPNDLYYPSQHHIIANILKNPDTVVMILCSPEDEQLILGYSVFSRSMPLIHFMYVKFPYRNVGCAGLMFKNIQGLHGDDKVLFCTHVAKKWNAKAKKSKIVYDPFLLAPYILGNRDESQGNIEQENQPVGADATLVQE